MDLSPSPPIAEKMMDSSPFPPIVEKTMEPMTSQEPKACLRMGLTALIMIIIDENVRTCAESGLVFMALGTSSGRRSGSG